MKQRDSLLLLAHGSPADGWELLFVQLRDAVQRAYPLCCVSLAFLQFKKPTVDVALEELFDKNIESVKIWPLFLGTGVHVKKDLPNLVDRMRKKLFPMEILILPPLGEDPLIVDFLLKRAGAFIADGVSN